MEPNPALAQWLLGHRIEIEARLRRRLGPAAPRASGPEAETLRRFRTFVSTALMRGEAPPPSLDGLRPDERRVMSLLSAWKEAASELAGPEGDELGETLKPLLVQFRLALRTSSGGRSQRARTSSPRRAVPGAIDRIADPFLAIDVGTATLVDANPAAGALLGVERDSLFGLDLMGFVPEDHHADWWSQLDAVAESNERVAFGAALKTVTGEKIGARASATAFNSRGRTVALVLLWSDSAGDAVADATAPEPDSIASSTASTSATRSTSSTPPAPSRPSPAHEPSPPPESNPQAVLSQADIPTDPSESS
jgi:PAS domain-containing protein